MEERPPAEVTELLQGLGLEGKHTLDELVESLYGQLRARARAYFRGEGRGHTLQPTALVHEVYVRLVEQEDLVLQNRAHFLACAATAMRHILVNHAKKRRSLKRGGEAARVPLEGTLVAFEDRALDLASLDEALVELARRDETKSRIVELRFFGGLTIAEVARVLERSHATVEREWRFARAWLYSRLCPEDRCD